MNPIYEKLFDSYGYDILKEAGTYDEEAICALLEQYAPDQKAQLALEDTWGYPCSTIKSAVSAPSRFNRAWGASSTWAPIFPAEI